MLSDFIDAQMHYFRFIELLKKVLFILRTAPRLSLMPQVTFWLKRRGKILTYKNLFVDLGHGASVTVLGGVLSLGKSWVARYRGNNLLLMKRSSQLLVRGDFIIYNDFHIVLNEGAELILGGGYINHGLNLECSEKITIGCGVAIGPNVSIRDDDSKFLYVNERSVKKTSRITIGDNVWIGEGAKILKGVSIGDWAVVASGSVVCHDVKPNTMVAGVPAVVIRENVRWAP